MLGFRASTSLFVRWAELRALSGGTARRPLVYLEGERLHRATWRRTIDATLLATLGILAEKRFHQRATLRRAAEEVTRADNRYVCVRVEPRDARGVRVLTARRREKAARA